MNSLMNWYREWDRLRCNLADPRTPGESVLPGTGKERFIYVFRSLFNADFWLLVLLIEMLHSTWILLPLFALGTHIYWISGFLENADRFVP